jgi:hypothetical protein
VFEAFWSTYRPRCRLAATVAADVVAAAGGVTATMERKN